MIDVLPVHIHHGNLSSLQIDIVDERRHSFKTPCRRMNTSTLIPKPWQLKWHDNLSSRYIGNTLLLEYNKETYIDFVRCLAGNNFFVLSKVLWLFLGFTARLVWSAFTSGIRWFHLLRVGLIIDYIFMFIRYQTRYTWTFSFFTIFRARFQIRHFVLFSFILLFWNHFSLRCWMACGFPCQGRRRKFCGQWRFFSSF